MDFEQRYWAMETRAETLAGEFLRSGDVDRRLLPARLSRPHAEARERALLSDRRGSPQRRVSGLYALPPG